MFIHVLGNAQDGGYPQIGCNEVCCKQAWKNPDLKKYPSSIAAINQSQKKYWIFDITPEVKSQVHLLNSIECSLAGIFITHAHIGHYMGLINLGLEVMNLKEIPVYVMPKMRDFIMNNTLLNQLVENNNINLITLKEEEGISVDTGLSVEAFNVPHRNELSETVGYKIIGEKKSAIYLPDIDSWINFENNLRYLIDTNDILFIDGTFYDKDEIVFRDISKIPHPAIKETIKMLSDLSPADREKIHFIHFNHTNDAIRPDSNIYKMILDSGFSISEENQKFNLG